MDAVRNTTVETGRDVRPEQLEQLREIIAVYDGRDSNLIQILHMAQAIWGYLPDEGLRFIAGQMELPMSRLYGVVSFYSYFSTQPKGRHTIQVCLGTACYVRGGKEVMAAIRDELGIDVGETTPDRRFSLEVKRCIGACGLAPAVSVDGTVHRRVSPKKVRELLAQYS